MRTRIAGLVASTCATVVVLIGALGGVPAATAEPDPGPNLTVTIVDTNGRPTIGAVLLAPVGEPGMAGIFPLGQNGLASSYQQLVPPGDYAVLALTGWGGVSCFGVTPCAIPGGPDSVGPTFTTALTVPASGTKTFRITSGLPALQGSGTVGSPLNVTFPAGFAQLQDAWRTYFGSQYAALFGTSDLSPSVVWKRSGVEIPGATGTTYVPTAQDAGKAMTATVAYNSRVAAFIAGPAAGSFFTVPAPHTTDGIAVARIATRVALKVPAQVKQGQRPRIRITLRSGSSDVSGWTKVSITRAGGSHRVMVRKGFASWRLPKLKPGRHTVTVTFRATSTHAASTASKTITVKGAKPKKHQR